MSYRDYSETDFIKDEFFNRWIYNPDNETNQFWQRWVANNPDKVKEVKIAREFLEGIRFEDEFSFPEKEFTRIHENIISFNQKQNHLKLGRRNILHDARWLSVAAIIIFLIAAAITFDNIRTDVDPKENALTYITKETVKGFKYSTILPDGTKVKLNSASSIRFPEVFSDDKREIFLEGEAFFEVVKDPNKPFIVHSNGIATEVLGTSFNIRSYQNEIETSVALVEGKVKVSAISNTNESVFLVPNQMVVYNQNKGDFSKEELNFKEVIGWKDGILSFDDVPLREVFNELELWYGVEIQFENSVSLTDLYKGDFKNESLENVLSGIGYASGFDFRIQDKKVEIYSKK